MKSSEATQQLCMQNRPTLKHDRIWIFRWTFLPLKHKRTAKYAKAEIIVKVERVLLKWRVWSCFPSMQISFDLKPDQEVKVLLWGTSNRATGCCSVLGPKEMMQNILERHMVNWLLLICTINLRLSINTLHRRNVRDCRHLQFHQVLTQFPRTYIRCIVL